MKVARWLVIFLFAALGVARAQWMPYVIDDYKVDITLDRSSELRVREQLSVTFNESRRGIFRTIPFAYESTLGRARSVYVDGISVTDTSGNAYETKVTREGKYIKVRVGKEDLWYSAGTKRDYIITYRILGAINWFEDSGDWGKPHAEIYWNAIGDEWDTVISRATCTVSIPADIAEASVSAKVFWGAYGMKNNLLVNGKGQAEDGPTDAKLDVQSGRVTFTRNTPLQVHEGVTMVVSVPNDAIVRPALWQSVLMFLVPNAGFLIPVLVILGMAFLWFLYGRDPSGGPVVVQFEPPDGMSGPEVGTIIDETVDQRDIAAGFISLCVKGYLRVHPKEVGMLFKRRAADLEVIEKPNGQPLTTFEQNLLGRLGRGGRMVDEIDLRNKVAPHLSELQNDLYDALVQRGFYRTSPNKSRTAWGCGGIIVVILLAIASTAVNPIGSPLAAWVGGIVGGILVILFARAMPRRTKAGSVARAKVLGFEEFIRRAKGNELEWQDKREPSMSLFEEYLPHAIAFGLTAQWAQAFEGVLHEMPSWYVSNTPGYQWYYFSNDLTAINTSIASAASTPPRSSGASGGGSGFSSGGGFSGGGFGGGGGGSW